MLQRSRGVSQAWCHFFVGVLVVFATRAPALVASPASAEQVEFFESRIRPVLAEHCYECHNSVGNAAGDLAVDYRGGLLKGGRGALPSSLVGRNRVGSCQFFVTKWPVWRCRRTGQEWTKR